jgi:DnaJ-class molecular chaperone
MTRRGFLALATLCTGVLAGCNPIKLATQAKGQCPACKGAGKSKCIPCNGTGVGFRITGPGLKGERGPCQSCHGTGSVECGFCKGTGRF